MCICRRICGVRQSIPCGNWIFHDRFKYLSPRTIHVIVTFSGLRIDHLEQKTNPGPLTVFRVVPRSPVVLGVFFLAGNSVTVLAQRIVG